MTPTPRRRLQRKFLSPAFFALKKAGDGNRTHVSSLEGWCSTIELHPHVTDNMKFECPVSESNQRHKDFQSFALPTELTGLILSTENILHDFK